MRVPACRHWSVVARFVVGSLVALALVLSVTSGSAYQSGSGSFPPPAAGASAHNSFALPLSAGASYVDPVFGKDERMVRRRADGRRREAAATRLVCRPRRDAEDQREGDERADDESCDDRPMPTCGHAHAISPLGDRMLARETSDLPSATRPSGNA